MANRNSRISSPVAMLALSRAAQQVAQKHDDPDLLKYAQEAEAEAKAELEKRRQS